MPTLKEIQEKLKPIKTISQFGLKAEIEELPRILASDETLETAIAGQYTGWTDYGLVVATDRRLVFVNKKKGFLQVAKLSVEDFPYDRITSVQYETGAVLGKLTIHASGNRAEINKVNAQSARDFAEWVRRRISSPKAAPPTPVGADDPVQRLQQLKTMLDAGLITQTEYDVKRKDILSRM